MSDGNDGRKLEVGDPWGALSCPHCDSLEWSFGGKASVCVSCDTCGFSGPAYESGGLNCLGDDMFAAVEGWNALPRQSQEDPQ